MFDLRSTICFLSSELEKLSSWYSVVLMKTAWTVHGGKLFNSLPKYLRNMAGKNLDDFKEKLDNYLQSIPDEPKVDGYIPSACEDLTAKPSNSILFQCKQKIRNKGCWTYSGGGSTPLSVSLIWKNYCFTQWNQRFDYSHYVMNNCTK